MDSTICKRLEHLQLQVDILPKVFEKICHILSLEKKLISIIDEIKELRRNDVGHNYNSITIYEDILGIFSGEIENLLAKFDKQEGVRLGDRDIIDSIERKMQNFELSLVTKAPIVSALEHRIDNLELTSDSGTFIWKITDYNKKLQDVMAQRLSGNSINSPYFYSQQFGYKMCAQLFPDGDDTGYHTHVSLYIVLMQGPYDALLSWPFLNRVDFTLIDHNSCHTTSYNNKLYIVFPNAQNQSFHRPTTEQNVGSGIPQLVTLDEMKKYVKDDVVFIKIVVE